MRAERRRPGRSHALGHDNLNRLARGRRSTCCGPGGGRRASPEGMQLDGGMEARHFLGDSAVVGLVTRLDPVCRRAGAQGLEAGYTALVGTSTRVRRGDVEIRVGGIVDLIRSKELLQRAKDCQAPWPCCTSSSRSWRRDRRQAPPRNLSDRPLRSGSCTAPRHGPTTPFVDGRLCHK